jgi:hypothetical protein
MSSASEESDKEVLDAEMDIDDRTGDKTGDGDWRGRKRAGLSAEERTERTGGGM